MNICISCTYMTLNVLIYRFFVSQTITLIRCTSPSLDFPHMRLKVQKGTWLGGGWEYDFHPSNTSVRRVFIWALFFRLRVVVRHIVLRFCVKTSAISHHVNVGIACHNCIICLSCHVSCYIYGKYQIKYPFSRRNLLFKRPCRPCLSTLVSYPPTTSQPQHGLHAFHWHPQMPLRSGLNSE